MENRPIEVLQLAFKSRRLQYFANKTTTPVDMGAMAVVSVDRGEDMGRVLNKLPVTEENMGRIDGYFLRLPSEEDLLSFESNVEFEKEVLRYCASRVRARKIDMRLTACESQLDRNRIRIFFTADQRTDFRGLVRDLASAFRARIEMRQIGVRDDARYKDGVGICGRRLCCAGFLNSFRSVTLKSVREQHLSPNPSKVSGVCSRLMCCLEYETDFYHKVSKTYPLKGAKVRMSGLQALVRGSDVFRETVTVRLVDTGEEKTVSIEEYHRSLASEGASGKREKPRNRVAGVTPVAQPQKSKSQKNGRAGGRGRSRRKKNVSREKRKS